MGLRLEEGNRLMSGTRERRASISPPPHTPPSLINGMNSSFKAKIRQHILDNYPKRFKGYLDDPDFNAWPSPMKIAHFGLEALNQIKQQFVLIEMLANPHLRFRHWEELSSIVGFDLMPNKGSSLRHFINYKLERYFEKIQIISTAASREAVLLQMFENMQQEWTSIKFETTCIKNQFALGETDSIREVLDGHMNDTMAMRGSAFVKPIKDQMDNWLEFLLNTALILDKWTEVQEQWLSFLGIFSIPAISIYMREETKIFEGVDQKYSDLLATVKISPQVRNICEDPNTFEVLHNCLIQLEIVEKGVNSYIQDIRMAFPRMFFLTNREALYVISETHDPHNLEPYIGQCFEGIRHFCLTERNNETISIINSDNEELRFITPIFTNLSYGNIEKWLIKVESEMFNTLKHKIKHTIPYLLRGKKYDMLHDNAVPGQVISCAAQVMWTADVQTALADSIERLTATLHKYQEGSNELIDIVKTTIPNLKRTAICSFITQDLHNISVIEELLDKKITSTEDFLWSAQMRYYWSSENVIIEMMYTTILYGYEYGRSHSYAVDTPSTDRCYRSILCTYHLHLYGAVVGPSGVGKTETFKNLTKRMAIKAVLHDCSCGIELSTIEMYLSGTASCGSWLCLKEIGDIDSSIISVLSQKLLMLSQAVMSARESFIMLDLPLKLKTSCMMLMTITPKCTHQDLPKEMKVMFRPVPLGVPDLRTIFEITLCSQGFLSNKLLTSKLLTLFKAYEELSVLEPYNFGVRTFKMIVSAMNDVKQQNLNHSEMDLLGTAVKRIFLPRVKEANIEDFILITKSILPHIEYHQPYDETVIESFKQAYSEKHLQCDESGTAQIMALYEAVIGNRSVIVVGPPFGGKSVFLQILHGFLRSNCEDNNSDTVVINPSILSNERLYGMLDKNTAKWRDGIITSTVRTFSSKSETSTNLLVFDGTICDSWTEGMNTLLDENKKLCLCSGETIQLHTNSIVVFEVDNMELASPSLVSRCGLVNFDLVKNGWKLWLDNWIENLPVEWKDKGIDEKLGLLLVWLFPACLQFINTSCRKVVDDGPYHNVTTALKIIDFQLTSAYSANIDSIPNGTWTIAALILGILWGLGGALDCPSKLKLDAFFKDLYTGNLDDFPVPEGYDIADMTLPEEGSLYDYGYLFRIKGGWKPFNDIVKTMKLEDEQDFGNMIIPTTETLKYLPMMKYCVKENIPVLLCGPSSAGKTIYAHHAMHQDLSSENYSLTSISLTGATTPHRLQEIILSRLIKLRKGMYSSPPGKTSIVFLDDLSIPCLYGNHTPVLELIRQYCDYSYWYDTDDLSKLNLKNIYLFGTIGNGRGLGKMVTPRLLRHFTILAVSSFSDETLSRIFSNFLLLGLRKNGFPVDINSTVNSVIAATRQLYKGVRDRLRPTPTNCHYMYSLKDFYKVLQGILLVRKETADNKRVFIRLWVHEVFRVFGDRISNKADRHWFTGFIRETVEQVYEVKIQDVFEVFREEDKEDVISEDEVCEEVSDGEVVAEESAGEEDLQIDCEVLGSLIFSSGILGDVPDERRYEEASLDDYHRFMTKTLEDYNASHDTKLSLILFRYVLEHVARLCRVFIIPSASIILISIGGAGRQSFIKLATAVGGETIFKINGSPGYGQKEWKSDLRKVLKLSGGEDKETVLVFSEFKANEDYYYQDIDALLISGEVPNLFVNDDLQDVLEMTRLAAQGGNRNLDINPSTVFQFFVNRSKKNLHLVICMCPVGNSFRQILQMYPSFLSCCLVDWYEEWPRDAMSVVAESFMKDVDIEESIKSSIVNVTTEIHFKAIENKNVLQEEHGRKTFFTSKMYLDFMELFKCTYLEKLIGLTTQKERYVNGLSKLASAEKQVFKMQHDLAVLQPQLKTAMDAARVMFENVEKERITVDKASYHVMEDEKVANIQAEAAIALKTECENDLALAIPILEDAIEALNTLKPTDITLVKSMKNPPDNVKLVMAAVCVMKDVKPDRVPDPSNPGRKIMDFWGPSKRILGDMAFLQTLKDYDKDNIPPHIMQTIRKVYIPNKDFRPNVVAKASSAAEGLCKWVLAMDKYDTVVKMVAPKKKKLATAEEEYGRTIGLLEEKRAELILLQNKLKDLNTTLSAAVTQRQKFEKEVELCAQKLRKAETIIDSLFSEKERWTGQVNSLTHSLQTIIGDTMISTAGVSYLGPFTKLLREKYFHEILDLLRDTEIPVSESLDFTSVLLDRIEIENWIYLGLSDDKFSIESGAIFHFMKRWPLCIDNHSQANKWIRVLINRIDGCIVRASDENCLRLLQDAIATGKQILVENLQDHTYNGVNPFLELLTHPFDIREGILINQEFVRFSPGFRLYMTTNIQNPYYSPQAYSKIALIDFTLGEKGLSEQLVTAVVEIERKEISLDRNSLIQTRSSCKRDLKEAEDAILELLSTESNIVDDQVTVGKLKSCKAISNSAQNKEIECEKSQLEIDEARNLYTPLANYCTQLFMTISDLHNINFFYQYSVEWFIAKFVKSIKSTKHDEICHENRVASLKEHFTSSIHRSITISVLNKHKLLVSFLICTTLLRYDKKVSDQDWDLFCQYAFTNRDPIASIIQGYSDTEKEINRLSHIEPFEEILENFLENKEKWERFRKTDDTSFEDIPPPINKCLTDYQKLLIFRFLRPDKMTTMIRKYINQVMGASYTEQPGFDFHDIYKDFSSDTIVLFLLASGSDAMPTILEMALRLGVSDGLKVHSLGKLQESMIEQAITNGQNEGHWVCIQNCDLADTQWLENFTVTLQVGKVNQNFRLFLTSAPNEKVNVFAKLLFGVSFFHAVVKSRETFDSLGWNLPYNFDEYDYSITIKNLQFLIQSTSTIPMDALYYSIGHFTYGGKVINEWDKRILDTLVTKYINLNILTTMGYCLSGSDEKYVMPIGYSQVDYTTFIQNLPESTNPKVLGFHSNSDFVKNIKEGTSFCEDIREIVLSKNLTQGLEETRALDKIQHILNRINPLLGQLTEYQTGNDYFGRFMKKELNCYQTLLNSVQLTLEDLKKGCLGLHFLKSDQELMINEIMNNAVPQTWLNVSYPTMKSLPPYIDNLTQRFQFLAEWQQARSANKYWLPAFFNPRVFFLANMMDHCKSVQKEVGDLRFDYMIDELDPKPSREQFQIHGLYLESCRWNRQRRLIEERNGFVLYEELPAITVTFIDNNRRVDHRKYVCPIYSTALRERNYSSRLKHEQYIEKVCLDCEQPSEQWILKGASLLAQIE
ncbi:hypothetical protein GE061_000548 [Apolygus lucorum]|uniref:Dynein heavy chain 7, axonemal n=1 Tax=Apolygus lucorum TaxID=248454 RepID=A0A8S9Y6R6_APOLU|nr:hypothetical protein GE061_000548 [Apolygus lucorum]